MQVDARANGNTASSRGRTRVTSRFTAVMLAFLLSVYAADVFAGPSSVTSQMGASSASYKSRVVPEGNDIQSKLMSASRGGDFGNERVSKVVKADDAQYAQKVKKADSASYADVVDRADNVSSDYAPLVIRADCVTEWTSKGSAYVCY